MAPPAQLHAAGPVKRYRSVWSQVFAWVWYLLAVVVLVDLVRRGSGRELAVGATFLALVSALVVALAHRPALLVDDSGLVVRNIVRDISVPWSRVRGIGTRWSLSLRTDAGDFGVWAVAARNPSRTRSRAARRLDQHDPSARPPEGPVSVELMERLDRYQRSAPQVHEPEPPVRVTWAWPVIAAVAVTAVAFVVALLVT
jgi:hypothetical protein